MTEDTVVQLISTFIGGSLMGIIVTHLLYKSKLDKEGQAKIENNIREDIYSTLIIYKEVIEDLSSNEIMYYEGKVKDKNVDFFDFHPISPTILISMEYVNNHYDKIYKMRSQHFDKLNEPLAATLFCLERYFLNLQKYLQTLHQDQYSLVGSVIITDFQQFTKTISTLIYKEFGQLRSEYFEHYGESWEQTKEEYIEILWQNSKLRGLMFPETLSNSNSEQILVHISQALEEGVSENSMEENESVKEVQRILNKV